MSEGLGAVVRGNIFQSLRRCASPGGAPANDDRRFSRLSVRSRLPVAAVDDRRYDRRNSVGQVADLAHVGGHRPPLPEGPNRRADLLVRDCILSSAGVRCLEACLGLDEWWPRARASGSASTRSRSRPPGATRAQNQTGRTAPVAQSGSVWSTCDAGVSCGAGPSPMRKLPSSLIASDAAPIMTMNRPGSTVQCRLRS